MEYETLKDQWSDVEDRDGIRLSWNTFPSSRMVCVSSAGVVLLILQADHAQGSVASCGTYWSPLYSFEREAGYATVTI